MVAWVFAAWSAEGCDDTPPAAGWVGVVGVVVAAAGAAGPGPPEEEALSCVVIVVAIIAVVVVGAWSTASLCLEGSKGGAGTKLVGAGATLTRGVPSDGESEESDDSGSDWVDASTDFAADSAALATSASAAFCLATHSFSAHCCIWCLKLDAPCQPEQCVHNAKYMPAKARCDQECRAVCVQDCDRARITMIVCACVNECVGGPVHCLT